MQRPYVVPCLGEEDCMAPSLLDQSILIFPANMLGRCGWMENPIRVLPNRTDVDRHPHKVSLNETAWPARGCCFCFHTATWLTHGQHRSFVILSRLRDAADALEVCQDSC